MANRVRAKLVESARQRAQRLARLDRRLDVLVFVAALMSIPAVAQPGELTGTILVIDIAAWLIFVLEALVKVSAHGREEYLRDRWNWIDLGIILLSAPYHLLTGIPLISRLGSLARLARLVRISLVMIKVLRQGRRLLSRRNVPAAVGLVALAATGAAALAFTVESRAGNEAFGSFGDALWWSMVTLTTVGYGDVSPTTTIGRIAAVFLMLVGIAFLGTLAATLASLFISDDAEGADESSDVEGLRAEMASLRKSIDDLAARLDD